MAMKKSDLLKEYFNANKYSFLAENTCLPFENWENFLEEEPDEYGNNIKHYRKKIYNFVPKELINSKIRKKLLILFRISTIRKFNNTF